MKLTAGPPIDDNCQPSRPIKSTPGETLVPVDTRSSPHHPTLGRAAPDANQIHARGPGLLFALASAASGSLWTLLG